MEKIRQIFDAEVRDGIANGACVLSGPTVGEADFCMETGFGDNAKLYPMTQDSVIDIASCTKAAATVTALLIAHSRGIIDFDAPFTEYLPQYTGQLFAPVTVRDLANHTSGFHDVPGEPVCRYFAESGRKMLENVLHQPPPFPPTDHAIYACWNYVLLCRLLENTLKMPLPEFAEKNIFAPLGMASSSFGAPKPEIDVSRWAQTPRRGPGMISDYVAYRIFRDGGTTGNAGMFSTAADLAKLLQVYLRHGDGLFAEKSFAEIVPDRKLHVDGYRRFGWVIWDNHLHESAFGNALLHSGWSGQTIYMNFKLNRYTIVLTPRQGDYERSKCDRFAAIALLEGEKR